jgi:hypothetical protein
MTMFRKPWNGDRSANAAGGWLRTISVAGLLLQGCGAADDDGSLLQAPIIFGADNRVEFGGITDPTWLHYAQATGALFETEGVSCSSGSCALDTAPFLAARTGSIFDPVALCANAPYRGQEAGAGCTAFLVGPDLFATAGHCLCNDINPALCPFPLGDAQCDSTNVVFGFVADASGNNEVLNVPQVDVYSCTEVVGVWEETPTDEDWAIFRVDREVRNRIPLVVRHDGTPRPEGQLLVAGHPDGLPLKLAGNGGIRGNPGSDPVNWTSSLDAFGGNSGSPVIQLVTGVVEGIHVRRPYHHYQSVGGCAMPTVCSETTGCNPNFGDSPWAQETNIGWVAEMAELPLHAALITAL